MSYYSAQLRGFIDPRLGGDIPADAVEITDEYRAALLEGITEGKQIVPNANGFPVLEDRQELPLTIQDVRERRLAAYREESDALKIEAEYDALAAGVEPDYSAWLARVAEIKERYPLPVPIIPQ